MINTANRELKIGMKVYDVYADPEDSIELMVYVVKTIQRKRKKKWEKDMVMPIVVRLVHKDTHTWAKLSRKSGDYGWNPNIAECSYTVFELEEYKKSGLPSRYSFSKSGAYQMALRDAKNRVKKEQKHLKNNEYEEKDIPGAKEYLKLCENLVSKLKGLYTKAKRKR